MTITTTYSKPFVPPGCYESDPQLFWKETINPLSPSSDQQQFSPNNIHTLSWDEVMRINKMIT